MLAIPQTAPFWSSMNKTAKVMFFLKVSMTHSGEVIMFQGKNCLGLILKMVGRRFFIKGLYIIFSEQTVFFSGGNYWNTVNPSLSLNLHSGSMSEYAEKPQPDQLRKIILTREDTLLPRAVVKMPVLSCFMFRLHSALRIVCLTLRTIVPFIQFRVTKLPNFHYLPRLFN